MAISFDPEFYKTLTSPSTRLSAATKTQISEWEKQGYSISPIEGGSVAKYGTVSAPRTLLQSLPGKGYSLPRQVSIPLYQGAAKPSTPASSTPAEPPREPTPEQREAFDRTDQYLADRTKDENDRIYGSRPGYEPPRFMFTGEGNAVNDVANYANAMDSYGQNYTRALSDRAETSEMESGSFLKKYAQFLPKAPATISNDELFKQAQNYAALFSKA